VLSEHTDTEVDYIMSTTAKLPGTNKREGHKDASAMGARTPLADQSDSFVTGHCISETRVDALKLVDLIRLVRGKKGAVEVQC
jgi:hypothetical protein